MTVSKTTGINGSGNTVYVVATERTGSLGQKITSSETFKTQEIEFVRLCINARSKTDENQLQKYLKQIGPFVRCTAIMTRCIFKDACLIIIRIVLIRYVWHVCIVNKYIVHRKNHFRNEF